MRVAHFIQRYPPALGGSEAYFERLSRFLADRGDDVTVWTSAAFDLEAFWSPRGRCLSTGNTVENGVGVRRYGLWRMTGRRYLLKPLSLIPQRLWQCLTLPCNPVALGMWRDAGSAPPSCDIVHASAFPYAWPLVCGLRLARRLRVPFLLTPFLHLGDANDPSNRTRRSYTAAPFRWLLRAADHVFVQTPSEHAAVCNLGVPAQRVALQGLGVDPSACTGGDRQRARVRWHVGADEIVVGHLGNNSVEKGSVDLLLAASRLWQQGVAVTVVLAGPEMPNFRRFLQSYPFAARIRRLGVLSDDDKRDFFAGLDVFALPSRSDSFGLVLLEAWANGLPNVVYRAGGPADLVRHGRDGLVVTCGDVDALATARANLIGNEPTRRAYGRVGRQRVSNEFAWADKLDLVRNVMIDAVNQKPAAPARRAPVPRATDIIGRTV